MKNKGDFLMNNFLSFFIAVVCVVLFAFFIGNAIYQARASDELTNAKKTIELIEAKTNALDEGQKSELTIQGFAGAERWYIVGWNKNDPNRPEKCFFDSCICICNGASKEVCQEKGICKYFDGLDINVSAYVLRVTFPDESFRNSDFIPLSQYDFHYSKANIQCIPLQNSLFELAVSRKNDLINIFNNNSHDLGTLGSSESRCRPTR